jgi:hypothetical protein
MVHIPIPLDVPWRLKSADSAKSWVNELPDGRVQYCIEHQLIKGVSPAMIMWYLNHMTDMVEVGGQSVQQYRLWHPRDHIALTYLEPATDGRSFGPGAKVRIQEAFQANPRFRIDIKATVEFLDETGFAHHETFAGMRAAHMRYSFTETEEGTLYENSLTAGVEGNSLIAKFVNAFVLPRVFSREKGQAWIRHNIEEVGAFESFLPQLYADRGLGPRST